ncbi:hypothetical protein LINGRAHAP2_LOCUS31492 [Linum grandiflorum]
MVVTPEGVPSYQLLNCNKVVGSALPNGLRIVVTYRGVGGIKPAGDTLSFIGRYLGPIGRKTDDLPIYFKDWRLLDKSLKERVWIQYIKVIDHLITFCFVCINAAHWAAFITNRLDDKALADIQELNDQGISCDDINSDCLTRALGTKERKTRIRMMGHGITSAKVSLYS